MTDDPYDAWTRRLLSLSPDLSRDSARQFVHDLYAHAQSDLDDQRAEADFEREE
ncbi:hypothetical protein [Streptomyces sp. VRA16 Mangrove soil]|uniref:hypothetical protein n=1 Tax=Streptomyces sp. VRA16 Mangrove soil TaxID=2817434 RepID=UPI001A9D6B15|nr:hypothetical protein [Streptomyces sp. VRA16 Mangrove soil]MBO1335717.1 hypothetical protein [Streptomyces sp. VRA16 Mangrove soil]